jgi:hypothetical protein
MGSKMIGKSMLPYQGKEENNGQEQDRQPNTLRKELGDKSAEEKERNLPALFTPLIDEKIRNGIQIQQCHSGRDQNSCCPDNIAKGMGKDLCGGEQTQEQNRIGYIRFFDTAERQKNDDCSTQHCRNEDMPYNRDIHAQGTEECGDVISAGSACGCEPGGGTALTQLRSKDQVTAGQGKTVGKEQGETAKDHKGKKLLGIFLKLI